MGWRDLVSGVRFRSGLFDTVGSRVMALIICTSLPLASVAGGLAWHAYLATSDNAYERTQVDAIDARHEIVGEIEQARTALETLSDIGLHEDIAERAFQLVQSVSQQRFCLIALLDSSGKIVSSSGETSARDMSCGSEASTRHAALDSLRAREEDPVSHTDILFLGGHPYIRTLLDITYTTGEGGRAPGLLVAVKPMVGLDDDRFRSARHFEERPGAGLTDLWLYSHSTTPLPLTQHPGLPTPWSAEALTRLDRDLSAHRRVDRFRLGMTYYTLAPGYGPVSIVAVSRRSEEETRALHLFLARVLLIVLILMIELLLVALAARRYLVEPLEKLASSVADWRRHGVFQPDLPRALPLEIRQMERAFSRATRRLDRHEARLQRAAKQQDLLIREIHHRVKNNLQIVASLLNLQANRIRLPEAKEEFHLVRDRVRSLATLHRYLYPEGGLSALDIRAFLEELSSQIFTANNRINKGRVSLSLDVDQVPVTPDQAVPIALIVTEILTNALRYAFPDEREGRVRVSLHRSDDNAVLTLEDNGVGFDDSSPVMGKREGIGLQLVRGFARQLDGTLEIESGQGTRYRIVFAVQVVRRHLA